MLLRLKAKYNDLVNDILDKIPQNKLIHGKVLDPSIGGGQFMREVERRKREAGLSLDKIKKTCYGYATGQLAFNYAINKHGLVGTYKVSNFLEEDIDMKFDVIVGNPPFQELKTSTKRKDQASNLWTKFISRAISTHSADDGYIAMISPTTWISPSADLKGDYKIDGENRLFKIFNNYSTYANINDVSKHFKGVGSSFGYVVVDKSGNNGLTFSDNSDISLGFLPKSNVEYCKTQLDFKDNFGSRYDMDQENNKAWRIAIPITRALTNDNIIILSDNDMHPNTASKNEKLYLYVYANSKKECERVKKRLLDCLDILNKYCRFSGFLNTQTVKLIRN